MSDAVRKPRPLDGITPTIRRQLISFVERELAALKGAWGKTPCAPPENLYPFRFATFDSPAVQGPLFAGLGRGKGEAMRLTFHVCRLG